MAERERERERETERERERGREGEGGISSSRRTSSGKDFEIFFEISSLFPYEIFS